MPRLRIHLGHGVGDEARERRGDELDVGADLGDPRNRAHEVAGVVLNRADGGGLR